MSQFNGGMTVSLKISLMFWKLVMEKVMIEFANTKSAMPLTLKDRWCYDNVDATTNVDLCTFNF